MLNKLNNYFKTISEQFEGTPQQKIYNEFNDPDYYFSVNTGLRDLEGKSISEIKSNKRTMLRIKNSSPIIIQGIADKCQNPSLKTFLLQVISDNPQEIISEQETYNNFYDFAYNQTLIGDTKYTLNIIVESYSRLNITFTIPNNKNILIEEDLQNNFKILKDLIWAFEIALNNILNPPKIQTIGYIPSINSFQMNTVYNFYDSDYKEITTRLNDIKLPFTIKK